MVDNAVKFIEVNNNKDLLAYRYREGSSPAIMFCGGFQSSMTGNKAIALEDYCTKRGSAFCRFDYRGHGSSSGKFVDCTLTDWIQDASVILNEVLAQHDEVLLIGSSMGAWVSLHLAILHPEKVRPGLVTIAAAPDFLLDMFESATEQQQEEWRTKGIVERHSEYDTNPYQYSWRLIDDARRNWGLLNASREKKIPVSCRMRLLHGQNDEAIPWTKSIAITDQVEAEDVVLTLIKDGDHRLSRTQDLQRLISILDELLLAS